MTVQHPKIAALRQAPMHEPHESDAMWGCLGTLLLIAGCLMVSAVLQVLGFLWLIGAI